MDTHGAYALGRRKGEDHFSVLRVYEVGSDPFAGSFEEFLLGEPTYLRTTTMRSRSNDTTLVSEIWWVQEFKEEEGEALVGVSGSRNKPTSCWFPVTELEKLPEMLRLAVEYAF